MVRMLGNCSIGFSRPYDDGYRLAHPSEQRGNGAQTDDDVSGQPAFARNQEIGSTREPFTCPSKCRWAP